MTTMSRCAPSKWEIQYGCSNPQQRIWILDGKESGYCIPFQGQHATPLATDLKRLRRVHVNRLQWHTQLDYTYHKLNSSHSHFPRLPVNCQTHISAFSLAQHGHWKQLSTERCSPSCKRKNNHALHMCVDVCLCT